MSAARRDRRGSNSIEFGLLLPVYLMLSFGIIDFGWLMYHLASLHGAAHAGCRQASVVDPGEDEQDMATVVATAQAGMSQYFDTHGPGCPDSGCATSANATGSRPSRSLACRIEITVDPLVGFNLTSIPLAGSAVVRLEHQRSDS